MQHKPLQCKYCGRALTLRYDWAHIYIEHLSRAVRVLEHKYGKIDDLILQIPLPLHAEIVQIMAVPNAINPPFGDGIMANIFGVRCVPGYEARIVLHHPASIYETNLMAVIDFEVINGECQKPLLSII